ncbi:MAG TPA: DEAD/DEAH box helicase [Ktedonobacteraceae bacterium]|nr:DEAD/DEAH box helicase [Ktedonobacteraceae bacterium]
MLSRPINPTAMAFSILEEYQKAIKDTVEASGCAKDLQQKILSDLYATDEVYLSINRPYKRITSTFADLCVKYQLHTQLKELFPQFEKHQLYLHQVQAIESILAACTTIISTGTGSGKTESFLLPLLDYCLKHQHIEGIKAIILYPINALVGDQLRRMETAAARGKISIGSFIGSTPQHERERMILKPPDILITNYVMLDRLITKERSYSLFEKSRETLRFMVVDEIHYYRGTKGANLCLLLRRLRTLCADKRQLIQIGASATLRQGGGYYNDTDQAQIESFARSLFGQEATQHFQFITPIYDDVHPVDEVTDPFPQTDQPLEGFLETTIDPREIRKLANGLAGEDLPPYHPGRGLPDPLFRFAKRNQFLQQMRKQLQKEACTIDQLAEVFSRVYYENHQQHPRWSKEMVYAYLRLVNLLSRRTGPSVPEVLLDYRLHLILSNLEGKLTRCLRCGRYHDGQGKRCRSCNGLLCKMIDGTISPPQFSLANRKLLLPHIYAYLLAGPHLKLLRNPLQFRARVERFLAQDELDLRAELGEEYEKVAAFLRESLDTITLQIAHHEQGYKRGLFPDYGFRKGSIPLLDPVQLYARKEDSEAGILTRREPEEAVRKLAPGRIVYCGGRPVRVNQDQPDDAYDLVPDPTGRLFRAYRHLIAEAKDEQYIFAKRDDGTLYLIKRTLCIREPLANLPSQGPGYCHLSLIRQGTLYFINEGGLVFGKNQTGLPMAEPFQDLCGEYRMGTSLTRDGLLLALSEQILPPDARANFLALLLRSIPDYFNLDDGELRVASNLEIFSADAAVSEKDKTYIFLYGHDESGLLPFERIYEHLPQLLHQRLQILDNCSCEKGCYHCLFSFSSQYLTGILDRQQAATFLRAYLGVSLLRPRIPLHAGIPTQNDVLLKVVWRGRCEIQAENRLTKSINAYCSDGAIQDQNTAIYTTIQNALSAEAGSGARSVQILCNPQYIHEQLQGKIKVTKGQEAFFQVMLTLRNWESWTSTVERGN